MNASEFMCYSMINTSAITALVPSTNIKHGMKWLSASVTTALPFIVVYDLPGGSENKGVCSRIMTVIARASKESEVDDISRAIKNLFNGNSACGVYGSMNGFELMRSSLETPGGLIYEQAIPCWSIPNDFRLVYGIDTIS